MQREILKSIGLRIVERRKELQFTQEQLAEQMNVSIQMISNLERGNKSIRIENLLKLCSILKVSADFILTGQHGSQDINLLTAKITSLSQTDYKMIELLVDYRLNNPSN